MRTIIRQAELDDVARVVELCRLLDAADEPLLTQAAAEARFTELHARPDHRIYVAQIGSEVVGTFALIFVGGLAHTARDAAVVEDVAVAPTHRRVGIGKAMMEFAMQQCARRGCYKLVLSSHLRRDEAHGFYESLGFRKHGYSFLISADALAVPMQ